MSANDIQHLIRRACGHEDAAGRHVDKYEQQMKAAGASMYEAFTLALKAAPDYKGRKIDDKAIARIYASTRPRPWWDGHIKAAGVEKTPDAGRERAKRLIQWHLDPEAAAARRAQRALKEAERRQKLAKQQRVSATRGPRMAPKSEAREATHAVRVTKAAEEAAHADRDAFEQEHPEAPREVVSVSELLAEVNRLSSAVRKVPEGARSAVRETLVVTAREVERYVS